MTRRARGAESRVSPKRLSALDAMFLELERPHAHMHVGWSAILDPPPGGGAPSYERLRDHIAGRLGHAQRFRQRLAGVPLGAARPVWVDDERFEIANHVRTAGSAPLQEVMDTVLSEPLRRDRPLWELWVVDDVGEGRTALVGKAHHCMVDGLGAVAFGAMLADPSSQPPRVVDAVDWSPAPAPSEASLLVDGIAERMRAPLAALVQAARGRAEGRYFAQAGPDPFWWTVSGLDSGAS